VLEPESPPSAWYSNPAPRSTRANGDEWISPAESAMLGVPGRRGSRRVQHVVNPRHAGFRRTRIELRVRVAGRLLDWVGAEPVAAQNSTCGTSSAPSSASKYSRSENPKDPASRLFGKRLTCALNSRTASL